MTQYFSAIYLPDDFDPSLVDKATERDIDALNDELVAAGVQTFVAGKHREVAAGAARWQGAGHRRAVPWRPRSTWAAFRSWKPLALTRRWSGGVRPSSPAGYRLRCVRLAPKSEGFVRRLKRLKETQ